jgi:hypothetical protein
MNKIALAGAIVIALGVSLPAFAQATAPKQAQPAPKAQAAPAAKPAAPASAPAAAPAPATNVAAAPAADAEKPVKKVRHRAPSKADARVCLEFPTTAQIIKCSEKYRWASAS